MVSENLSSHGWKIGTFFLAVTLTGVGAGQVRNRINPLRRVVNMLQDGKQEAALYHDFGCYCRSTTQELQPNAEEEDARITETTVQNRGWRRHFDEAEDCDQGVPRVACRSEAGLGKRRSSGKVASGFDDERADLAAGIDALTRAISALEKGVAESSFLQSHIGSAIRKVYMSAEKVWDSDRSTLLSFLSNGDCRQCAPQSGEIIGLLKELKDEMSAELSAAQKGEAEREANQAALVEGMKKELATLTLWRRN